MLKLYIRDNQTGIVHEYGTDPHDALILQEDGSLHYLNLQSCCGTKYPKEGYSFCLKNGAVPEADEEESYIDIGGERNFAYTEKNEIDFDYEADD